MQNQYKRYLFLFATLVVLLMSMSGTGVAFAQGHARLASSRKATSQTCGSWSVVSSPNVGTSNNQLNSVAAVSTNDVWAVGDYDNISAGYDETLIENWNGTSWSVVSSPNASTASNQLNSVAAVSANDVWAVGYYYNPKNNRTRTLIEQWNGTSWSVVASPDIGTNNNSLSSVAMVSASDIWAVGNYYSNATGFTRTLTLHWNGTSWSVASSPNVATTNNYLNGVAAVSTSDVWAVGNYYNSKNNRDLTLILNWNGTKWSRVRSPDAGTGSNILFGVAAVSTSDVWAVGENGNTLTLNWNGTSWSVVSSMGVSMDTNQLFGVAVDSTNDVWAVGYSVNSSDDVLTLIEQWNGTSWSVVSSPNVGTGGSYLSSVAVSNGDVWTVGYYWNNSAVAYQTLIEFYC